jgi:SAM-dependent methyltransferase
MQLPTTSEKKVHRRPDPVDNVLTNPIHICLSRIRQRIETYLRQAGVKDTDQWLDVGCGQRPYEGLFCNGTYTGLDVHSENNGAVRKKADIYYDGTTIPFDSCTFHGVICTQVLEHVARPRNLVGEIHRVLKPGGWFLFSVPFVWQEHEEPNDFFRYSRYGIKELAEKFTIISQQEDTNAIETIAILTNIFIMGNLVPPYRYCSSLAAATICFPIQMVSTLLGKCLPDNGKLYLNRVCLARKMEE